MLIRPAAASEVETLDQIAFRAKAFWGYEAHELERWRAELTTPVETLACRPTRVALIDDRIVGFAQLDPQQAPWELASLFTMPEYNRRGVGRALLEHMVEIARSAGQAELQIDADPNACGFYLACGAVQVGEVAAPIRNEPRRTRPQLRLPTGPRLA